MSRKKSRNLAMLITYSRIFDLPYSDDSILLPYESIFKSEIDDKVLASDEFIEEKKYIDNIVNGISNNIKLIDSTISKYLRNWTIDKISKVDLAILRVAVYEMLFFEDIPKNVVISEAMNLADEYSLEENSKFINGLLASICRDIK